MKKWKCRFCGHIYDEAKGDAETGIPPGTRFEDLPADWLCPNCGAAKRPHTACQACGYVRPGLQVKSTKPTES